MNKRGQIYILAAIVLSIAIFSVMKVTNKFVAPSEDNFDFFVENFEGERSYVMNLGLLERDDKEYYLKRVDSRSGLLETFQEFGINVGIVLIEYSNNQWTVINYLGKDNIVQGNCDGCEEFTIPSAGEPGADISFSLEKGSKKFRAVDETDISELGPEGKYYSHSFPGTNDLTISINNNEYEFKKPSKDKIESLLFKNVGENYVKVVKI